MVKFPRDENSRRQKFRAKFTTARLAETKFLQPQNYLEPFLYILNQNILFSWEPAATHGSHYENYIQGSP